MVGRRVGDGRRFCRRLPPLVRSEDRLGYATSAGVIVNTRDVVEGGCRSILLGVRGDRPDDLRGAPDRAEPDVAAAFARYPNSSGALPSASARVGDADRPGTMVSRTVPTGSPNGCRSRIMVKPRKERSLFRRRQCEDRYGLLHYPTDDDASGRQAFPGGRILTSTCAFRPASMRC